MSDSTPTEQFVSKKESDQNEDLKQIPTRPRGAQKAGILGTPPSNPRGAGAQGGQPARGRTCWLSGLGRLSAFSGPASLAPGGVDLLPDILPAERDLFGRNGGLQPGIASHRRNRVVGGLFPRSLRSAHRLRAPDTLRYLLWACFSFGKSQVSGSPHEASVCVPMPQLAQRLAARHGARPGAAAHQPGTGETADFLRSTTPRETPRLQAGPPYALGFPAASYVLSVISQLWYGCPLMSQAGR
ncbi:uncharacterized protein LOC123381756 [Felis catus]|uniref:uncharacterized protein LOC123381756 n=1 Tax=Felis catus TaxID=9685 RepID=UPI001D19C345|nr:uncharacterized protein LOC123381756 [Felis catus]